MVDRQEGKEEGKKVGGPCVTRREETGEGGGQHHRCLAPHGSSVSSSLLHSLSL